jgi:SAM-dependent methyltransferase
VSDLVLERLHDRVAYDAALARAADRIAFEDLLDRAYAQVDEWYLPAICQACGTAAGLLADRTHGWDGHVNFRERLLCPGCHLNTRQRFMAHLLRGAVADAAAAGGPVRVYLHEQVTPFFGWARQALGGEVVGSEYLGHDIPGGTVIDGVRHEDALALSFADASLDAIVSQDVLEHVPEIDPAIAEAARVLRPGGRFYITIPWKPELDVTQQRAAIRDGELVHLAEAQYHGNPVSAEGSLVFFDHGWDFLDRLRAHGFAEASLIGYWSALYGYLGGGLLTMFAATRG